MSIGTNTIIPFGKITHLGSFESYGSITVGPYYDYDFLLVTRWIKDKYSYKLSNNEEYYRDALESVLIPTKYYPNFNGQDAVLFGLDKNININGTQSYIELSVGSSSTQKVDVYGINCNIINSEDPSSR